MLSKEIGNTIHPVVAACTWRGSALEAMLTKGKSMELALDAHAAHLLPHLDRIHRRILVGIAMYEDHRSSLEIEVELGHEDIIVVVTELGVATIGTIGERVGRIDAYTPLHTARELVDIVDRIVGLLERRSRISEFTI